MEKFKITFYKDNPVINGKEKVFYTIYRFESLSSAIDFAKEHLDEQITYFEVILAK